MMTWMYGPGGVNAYVGAIGNDKLVDGVGRQRRRCSES